MYFGVVVLSALATLSCTLRSRGPERARTLVRGRPISEKVLVILGYKEACENTELSPLNDIVHLPRRLVKHGTLKSLNDVAVRCDVRFAGALPSRAPWASGQFQRSPT